MRKGFSWVLVLVGAFLLVAGIGLRFYAADALKRTPLSVDDTTRLSGTADKLNTATGEVDNLDVKVKVLTQSDDKVSTDDIIAFVTTTCVVIDEGDVPDCVDEDDPQGRLVTASTDIFASDRRTALAVDDPELLPEGSVPHEGLTNKWPFDAEKKTYPFWDGVLGRAVDAVYDGTETIDGLETYAYKVTVEEEPAVVIADIDGVYSLDKVINIDPVTGSIIRQSQRDVRTLENGDPLIDMQIEYTDETVTTNVDDAKSSGSKLALIGTTLPIVAILLGLAGLGAGVWLLLRGRGEDDSHDDASSDSDRVGV